MVEQLDAGLANLARIVYKQFNRDINNCPGCGAAGGLAAGAIAFMNARLVSGIKTLIMYSNLEKEMADADWVITGEGCFDRQSLYGKVVQGIAHAASKSKTQLAVIAGQVKLLPGEYEKLGIAAAISCKTDDISVEQAITNSVQLLQQATERFVKENLTR
jgi:glycerate kinase